MRPARLFLSLLVAASAPPAVRAESFQFQADVNKLMVRSRSPAPPRRAAPRLLSRSKRAFDRSFSFVVWPTSTRHAGVWPRFANGAL